MKVIYESYLRRHRNGTSNNNNNNGNALNIEICHPVDLAKINPNMDSEHLTRAHIISCDALQINKELGLGEFGVVQQGVWTNGQSQRIQVAIKCLSTARLENNREEFLKEAAIMHSISNENIVTLYGVVLEPSVMLVTELAPLRSLLECLKEPQLFSHFPVTSLCTFAAQIASGMQYLAGKKLIHRDLAARNILVFAKNKVKISDFGLSRALGVGKDYYQSNFNVNLKLPIAWCAPECINYLKFTSQSDVWAYGVTLWEMFSFGFQPWAALTGQQILEAIDHPNYQRLEQPECCPKEYYQLMLKCWTHEPNARPKFTEIVSMLPDCKPELLQAIRNSSQSGKKEECVYYRTGDIITVIDKSSRDSTDPVFSSFWKGVNNDRKTGFFNPSDFVAYLGQNLPSNGCQAPSNNSTNFVQHFLSGGSPSSTGGSSNGHHQQHQAGGSHHSFASTITTTVLQSSKFLRGFLESKTGHHGSNNSSPHGNRKARLRPEMISKPQEGKYHHLPKNRSASSSLDGSESISKKMPIISHPISSYAPNSSTTFNNCRNNGTYLEENHEYHEISDEDDFGPLESPPFEVLDFGPSLMEEVFRELDLNPIKPELNNETAESETAINENGINVKNEVRELNLKICKEAGNSKKKQSCVKHISEAEQNELESAIAMAKDIASRTMLEDELDLAKNDSPKTPNSPNKRKFSFKFPTHKSSPKGDRRTFSEETESIGNIIESITPEAKEAYLSLVEKGVSGNCPTNAMPKKEHFDKRPDVKPPPPPPATSSVVQPTMPSMPQIGSFTANLPGPSYLANGVTDLDNNPLRMLRTAGIGKVLRPKVRGNRSFSQPRLPTTAQTAGLARVASSRSQLGSPPPVPSLEDQGLVQPIYIAHSAALGGVNNALPLPPRDRSRPLLQLKTHQRRHPLVIPTELTGTSDLTNGHSSLASHDDLTFDSSKHESPQLVQRHVPVLKQVSCPQAPAAFLNVYNKAAAPTNSNVNAITSSSLYECDTVSAPMPLPPPKPNRTPNLTDDSTESLESAMQKAFESYKFIQNADLDKLENEQNNSIPNARSEKPSDQGEPLSLLVDTCPPVPLDTTISLPSSHNESIDSNSSQVSSNGTVSSQATKHSLDRDEVRVMQKVLGNEANLSDDECAQILDTTDWDIHKAIKCVRLRQQLRSHSIEAPNCDWAQMLSKFNWNIRQASNYLIATRGVLEDTTEV